MSTSFVTPDQATALDSAAAVAGGRYLDLSIPAYPREARSGIRVYLVSGSRDAYEEHRERFEQLRRLASFVDKAPAAAYVSEMAVLLAYVPRAVGLLQGLRMWERCDISLDWFRQTVAELYSSTSGHCSIEPPGVSPSEVEASIHRHLARRGCGVWRLPAGAEPGRRDLRGAAPAVRCRLRGRTWEDDWITIADYVAVRGAVVDHEFEMSAHLDKT